MVITWKRLVFLVLSAWLILAAAVTVAAAKPNGAPLPADQAFRLEASRLSATSLRLEWAVAEGYYLYRDSIKAAPAEGSDAPSLTIDDGVAKDDPTFGPTQIFLGRAEAIVSGPSVAPQPGASLTITYQGCQDDGICYPPVTKALDLVSLSLVSAAALPLFPDPVEPSADADEADVAGIVLAEDDGMVASLLRDGGTALLLGSFLLFGVALSFTPCVFPMYPILAGVLARSGDALSPKRGFVLAGAYVLAMASAFGLLGFVAAWSGRNLQMVLQAPATVLVMAVVFVVLALSMFGLFELSLPSRWVNAIERTGRGRGGSVPSAAVLGFTSALIVGPCVTAPLAAALLYIAQTGDGVLGAAALFALGLGKGIPLVVFGTVGARALPKPGPWMEVAKGFFGLVFLGAAIWMVSRIVSGPTTLALWAMLLIGTGVWIGAFDVISADSPGRRRVGKSVGLVAFAYGIIMAVGAAGGAGDPLRPLGTMIPAMSSGPASADDFAIVRNPQELGRAVAASGDRPSLVYVTADWCTTCAVIERNVLPHAGVRSALAGFNRIKLDVTGDDPEQRALMRSLRVAGPPTMFFLDASAKEVPGSRLVGDVTVERLLAAAGKADAR